MCDFCSLDINEFKRSKKGYNYAPRVYIEKDKNKYYLVSTGEAETKFEIIVCPVCGNRLI